MSTPCDRIVSLKAKISVWILSCRERRIVWRRQWRSIQRPLRSLTEMSGRMGADLRLDICKLGKDTTVAERKRTSNCQGMNARDAFEASTRCCGCVWRGRVALASSSWMVACSEPKYGGKGNLPPKQRNIMVEQGRPSFCINTGSSTSVHPQFSSRPLQSN